MVQPRAYLQKMSIDLLHFPKINMRSALFPSEAPAREKEVTIQGKKNSVTRHGKITPPSNHSFFQSLFFREALKKLEIFSALTPNYSCQFIS